MTRAYEYELCGFHVESCIELPAVRARASARPATGVTIRYGEVPASIRGATVERPAYQASPTELLLRIPEVGSFWVREGSEVVVARDAAADDQDVRAFLLGSVLGALCYQRRLLPLHASAVRVRSGCVAFCGVSGSGKSTIAALLAERGYAVVADDVCVVSEVGDGEARIWPGYPQLKLWSDAVDALRADRSALQPVRRRQDKYQWPVPAGFDPDPLRPIRVYVLGERGPVASWARLRGVEAVHAVARCSFRDELIGPMGLAESRFRLATAVARTASVHRFSPAVGIPALRRALDALEREWA